MGITLANSSGLILGCRVGKHTDRLLEELITTTEGKTGCKEWNSDDWGGYERVLPQRLTTTLAKTGPKGWSEPMASFANRQGVGIAARINLVRFGSKPKSVLGW
jgi:hypothetical protein